jgi:hypothetical protein
LGEEGGTLVDAAAVGLPDLLTELLPDADRSAIQSFAGPDFAELRLPGVVYRLEADSPLLGVATPEGEPLEARWVPRAGTDRVGAVSRGDRRLGGGIFVVDGSVDGALPERTVAVESAGQVAVRRLSQVAVALDGALPGYSAVEAKVDADFVEVSTGWAIVDRAPVFDGEVVYPARSDSTITGVRAGCVYEGLVLVGCAGLQVRVVDEQGRDLAATVYADRAEYPLPPGGGWVPLGLEAGEVWIWAGPAYTASNRWFAGADDAWSVVLERRIEPEETWADGATFATGGVVLAAVDVEVAPDASHGAYSADVLHALRAEGVGFAVPRADSEMPVIRRDDHDDLRALAATGADGMAWSWSWSATTARPGHGVPDLQGMSPLNQLSLLRGGGSADRFTVVTPAWVESALSEAVPYTWRPLPDALRLDSPADVDVFEALLDAWVPVVPVGPRTWVEYRGSNNTTAFEAGIREGVLSAGNGPRVRLSAVGHTASVPGAQAGVSDPFGLNLWITVEGPGWMGLETVELRTDHGIRTFQIPESGRLVVSVPTATWAYALVRGERAQPWGGDEAWAVSPVVWLRSPGNE